MSPEEMMKEARRIIETHEVTITYQQKEIERLQRVCESENTERRRLEEELHKFTIGSFVGRIFEENKRLRAALEWYACTAIVIPEQMNAMRKASTHDQYTERAIAYGTRARAALKRE